MQSDAKSVDAYLEEVPAERKEALTKLREPCRTALKGFDESIEYGMPSYRRSSEVEVAFAGQKNYISLYILKQEVMEARKEAVAGVGISFGKGCIRYSKPERTNFKTVVLLKTVLKRRGWNSPGNLLLIKKTGVLSRLGNISILSLVDSASTHPFGR